MRLSRIALILVSFAALGVGVWLGLTPIRAQMTAISPDLRRLDVSCGNGYLGESPRVLPGDAIEPPGERGVLVRVSDYRAYCDPAVGQRRLGSWALTALGALGLAITLAGAGQRGPVEPAPPKPPKSRRKSSDDDPEPDGEPEAGATQPKTVGELAAERGLTTRPTD